MTNCPKCSSSCSIKSGKINNTQRYKCKSCSYHYTVLCRSSSGTKEQKRQALELYLEGLGFRSIGRVLRFSHVAVFNWIKEFGKKLETLKSDGQIKIVEMDEMHSYISNKKITAGSGLLLIEIGINSSTALLVSETQRREKIFGGNL
jgi:transposase-like protein